MTEDGSIVVAGTYFAVEDDTGDFVATKIDVNGTVVWRWQVNVSLAHILPTMSVISKDKPRNHTRPRQVCLECMSRCNRGKCN